MSDRLGELDALERAARDLLDRLRSQDEGEDDAGAGAGAFADQIAALRQERAAADRRTEALLQGVQDVIDRLVDRLSADDRAAMPAAARQRGRGDIRGPTIRIVDPAALGELDELDPPRPPARLDPSTDGEANPPSHLEEDLLLEPGTRAPSTSERLARRIRRPARGPIPPSRLTSRPRGGPRSRPSRQAPTRPRHPAGRPSSGTSGTRGRFCSEHKRSLLLAAALVVAIAAAARVMGGHTFLAHGPDAGRPSAMTAATEVVPPARQGVAGPPGPAAQSIDTAPTGSIGRDRTSLDAGRGNGPTPPELSAAIPNGLAPATREAVLAGSPAAQYDLAQRLFEGRGVSQDKAAAAFWFERAASAGYAPAEFRLAALYQKGVGVQRTRSQPGAGIPPPPRPATPGPPTTSA